MVKDLLEERARELGLLFAWAPLDLPQEAEARHRAWLEAGRHGGMAYPRPRSASTRESASPGQKAPSSSSPPTPTPTPGPPLGASGWAGVARYAWTRDYHLVLGEALKALEETARGLGLKAKGYVDHGPLPERTLAALSGAGWIGKSGYFLSQAFGVHAFIGVLLTPLEVEAAPLHPSRCGRCARCLSACPTEALLGDGTLDARACVSYLTIEHKGPIPPPSGRESGTGFSAATSAGKPAPGRGSARSGRP